MTQLHGFARRARHVASSAILGVALVVAPALAAEVTGTADDDVLSGTPSADVISGLGGDDLLHGRAGADQLEGGVGDDVLIGDRGSDLIDVAAGREPLEVPDGADVLRGGYGPDRISTWDGDHAFGGGQNDIISNWQDNGEGVVLDGGYGADIIDSAACDFDCNRDASETDGFRPARLYGDAGADRISLDNPSGVARGGPGDDSMVGRVGHALYGGRGDDRIIIAGFIWYWREAGELDRIAGGRGDDEIDTSLGTITGPLSCGLGHDLLLTNTSQQWPSDCEETYFHLYGSDCLTDCGSGADRITGTRRNDWIDALWGDDTVKSLEGDDRVFLDSGSDTADAGAGDDHLFLDSGSDTADAGAGDDYVDAATGDERWREFQWIDHITCGPGEDTLIADANDTYVADCENVTVK